MFISPATHVGGAFSRPGLVATARRRQPTGERIRPSQYRPQSPPKHPPHPNTHHPTDTLEPCTES